MSSVKNDAEIVEIRKACKVAADVLTLAGAILRPGMTTAELDRIIESEILIRGAKPAFKGYRGYKHASCLSVNNEIVHGIPSSRVLVEGDIIGIDIGAVVNGFFGDNAKTFPVGEISNKAKHLLEATKKSLDLAIEKCIDGLNIGDISHAIESHAKANGYNVVRDLFGHGVGRQLHEDLLIPNFGKPGIGPKIKKGMTFAIEPMLNVGSGDIKTLADGWTVVTTDAKLSAHFEHTVLITDGEAQVLTRND